MKQVGRKIYYEKDTGNIILDTGERAGSVVETTVQQDFESYKALSERNPETVAVIHLPYGAFSQDFQIATSVRVDPENKSIQFAYPDPNDPEAEIVYERPLTQEVAELRDLQRNPDERYKALNVALVDIEDLRKAKEAQLNYLCEQTILNGFFYTVGELECFFSFDVEAQLNFQGASKMFDKGVVTELEWTVRVDGKYQRVTLNAENMTELELVMLQHKNNNVVKFRNELMPLVEAATTKEEINTINW